MRYDADLAQGEIVDLLLTSSSQLHSDTFLSNLKKDRYFICHGYFFKRRCAIIVL